MSAKDRLGFSHKGWEAVENWVETEKGKYSEEEEEIRDRSEWPQWDWAADIKCREVRKTDHFQTATSVQ